MAVGQVIGESIKGLASGIVKPITDVLTAGQRRKQAREEGLNKIRKAQVDGENTLNLSDSEWEALAVQTGDGTLKDEYVTLTMTAWIWVALIGAVMGAYDKPEVLDGVKTFVIFCVQNDIDLGFLTSAVVTAAIGLKVWRGR